MKRLRLVAGLALLASCMAIAGCGEANEGNFQSTAGANPGSTAPAEALPSDYDAYSSGDSEVTGGSGTPDYGPGYGQ